MSRIDGIVSKRNVTLYVSGVSVVLALWLFVGFSVLSIAWSFYPGATAVGLAALLTTTVAALFLGLCLSWVEFLRTFGVALRWVLGLSLLFEIYVAGVVGGPILPFFTDYDGKVPAAFYWSRGLLFDGEWRDGWWTLNTQQPGSPPTPAAR